MSIDHKRIYITGFSNGGGFTNLLARTPSIACQVAAFAAGSASLYPGTVPGTSIGTQSSSPVAAVGPAAQVLTDRGVPILEIHGTNDVVIPHNGRADKHGDADYRLPSIHAWLATWARRNGVVSNSNPDTMEDRATISENDLPSPTTTTHPFPNTTLYTWNCVGGADILGYVVQEMEHQWATSPPVPFDATRDVILPFFEQHAL